MALGRLAREVISRSAMGMLGALLVFGGAGCVRVAYRLAQQPQGGLFLPVAAACILLLCGACLLVVAALPTAWLYRLPLVGPPSDLGTSNDPGLGWRIAEWLSWW